MTPIANHALLHDHARDILADDPALTDEHRATIWDAWHSAPSVSALARKLADLDADIPPDTQEALLKAKKISTQGNAMDRVLDTMMQMDSKTLALAESHPAVLRVLSDAAVKE